MVAGLLKSAGYNTGDDYLAPRPSNPLGFFEDEAVNRINDRLLSDYLPQRRVIRWRGLVPRRQVMTGPGWLATPPVGIQLSGEAREISGLLERRPFAYKDPRFCHTLDAWRLHLPRGTRFICVFREPGRTVESILRMREDLRWYADLGLNAAWALQVWKRSYRSILEHHSRRGEWLFVYFDDLLGAEGVERLGSFLGSSLSSRGSAELKRSPDRPVDRDSTEMFNELRRRSRIPWCR